MPLITLRVEVDLSLTEGSSLTWDKEYGGLVVVNRDRGHAHAFDGLCAVEEIAEVLIKETKNDDRYPWRVTEVRLTNGVDEDR